MRCVKVEVVVLGSPCLISLMVSVDVKQHSTLSVSYHARYRKITAVMIITIV